MALSPLTQRLIDALKDCPCCSADRREENWPSDGIPDNCAYEAVFDCGAAVFVTTRDDFEVGRACPSTMELRLDELHESIHDALEAADA